MPLTADHVPEETRDWLHHVVADALRSALDEAEGDYRQLIAARWPEGAA